MVSESGQPGVASVDQEGWQLLTRAEIPGVFEEAFSPEGVGALVNPSASITRIEPLTFQPGAEIRLNVYYRPVNGESWWQTVVVVKEGGTVISQDRNQHVSMNPGEIVTVAKTGKAMPTTSVNLTVEIWGHGDYFHGGWPY